MRASRTALLLVACALAASCGPPDRAPVDPAWYRTQGLEAIAEERWDDAATSFAQGFALEDPVPDRAASRAWFAWRRGVALANAGRPGLALDWLRRARTLDPTLYEAHFDTAEIHDGIHAAFVDPVAAAAAYRAFLEGWADAGSPAPYRAAADHAAARLAALPADGD